jgi:hypothetical protein
MVTKSNQNIAGSTVRTGTVILMVSIGMIETKVTTVKQFRALWNVPISECEFRV